jgi:hypothetical protein
MFRDPSEDTALYRVETLSTQRAAGVSLRGYTAVLQMVVMKWLSVVAFRPHCIHLQGEARKRTALGNCSPHWLGTALSPVRAFVHVTNQTL